MYKILNLLLALNLVFTIFPSKASASVPQNKIPQTEAVFENAVEGQLLVKYESIDDPLIMSFASNAEALSVWQELSLDDSIMSIQPNFLYRAAGIPNDPLYQQQDYLSTINAYGAWDIAHDASNVVVAVIDSGVDISHPDLAPNIWTNSAETENSRDSDKNGYIDDIHGWDFVGGNNNVNPRRSSSREENAIGVQHGTSVAGILAASGNNGLGITGVAWKTQIMSVRVLNESGVGESADVTRAIRYAIENGADVINLSLVGTDYDQLVLGYLQEAYQQGVIVVVAAGNNGINLNSEETYPVCYNHLGEATIIGVASIDTDFNKPSFSNYGSNCVDIVAPGVEVYTTRFTNSTFKSKAQYAALFSGTSFSTPMVSGTIALMKQLKPSLTAEEALYFLQQGAQPITDPRVSRYDYQYVLDIESTLELFLQAQGISSENSNVDVSQNDQTQSNNQTSVIVTPPKPDKFIAYARGAWEAVVYEYGMPGPILLNPIVLSEPVLGQGIRFATEDSNYFLLNAWRENSKHLWQLNRYTKNFSIKFALDQNDSQTIGNVAVGNIDFDNEDEIVIVSGPGAKPFVSVYNKKGDLKFQFQAYPDYINEGLDVALVDLNNDGLKDIVTVPVSETNGLVRVFEYTGLKISEFEAYTRNFTGGANISSADVDGDGFLDIVIGPGVGGGPHVKAFTTGGRLITEFFAGTTQEVGGANADFFDFDQDGVDEFVVSYDYGHNAVIRTYTPTGQYIQELGVFDSKYIGGIAMIPL